MAEIHQRYNVLQWKLAIPAGGRFKPESYDSVWGGTVQWGVLLFVCVYYREKDF